MKIYQCGYVGARALLGVCVQLSLHAHHDQGGEGEVGENNNIIVLHHILYHIIYYLYVAIHMTGLLHEGIFHVGGVLKPTIFESLPRASMMCNWAQILICWRH